ncbi:MAG: DUF4037 domain-containing protein [Lachnospiraceae bacterium]|nr:DUF4037 domain-containing protein [Lachnospiraceae bacterium]
MKGLELSREYYNTYGKQMLEGSFKDYLPFISVGLIGSGSEVLGFDDEVSTDHDFEPGFCIFIPDEDRMDRKTAFQIERAYAKLPDEFMGYSRQKLSPVGGARHGVIRLSDFLLEKLGDREGNLNMFQWLKIPTQYLCEVTKGEIFHDGDGKITKIRENLSLMPKDIRLKRLAGHLLLMSQSGQYNYLRMIKHNEEAAAALCIHEYVKNAIAAIYFLNNEYMPYYKWQFRGLKELDILSELALPLEYLVVTANDKNYVNDKIERIELIAGAVIDELISQGITSAICGDLEKHAYSVNDYVNNGELRNMNILSGVGE